MVVCPFFLSLSRNLGTFEVPEQLVLAFFNKPNLYET
jgi:hypothetical protein